MLRSALRPVYRKAWRALARTPARWLLPGYADLDKAVRGFFDGVTPTPHYLTWAFTRRESPYTVAVVRAGGWISACELILPEMTESQRQLAWSAIPILSLIGALHPGFEGHVHAPRPNVSPSDQSFADQSFAEEWPVPPPVPGAPMFSASLPVGLDVHELRARIPGRPDLQERTLAVSFHTEYAALNVAHVVIAVPEPWERSYAAFFWLPTEDKLRPVSEPAHVERHRDFKILLVFDENTPVLAPSNSGRDHKVQIDLYDTGTQHVR